MKSGKKTVLKIILGMVAVFSILNVSWYIWRMVKYEAYCRGWEKNPFATWIVPRYFYTDADGYDYSVKYPEYLSVTGNLCVGLPATDGNPFTDFLIVWPKLLGGYEYGAAVSVDGKSYQIYVKADGTAVNSQDSEMAERCRDTIKDLLNRAKAMWNLE